VVSLLGFTPKTLRVVDQALIAEGYQGGIQKAYTDWVRNLTYERQIPIRTTDLVNDVVQKCMPIQGLVVS
jgi:hypothetical protein